MKRKTWIGIVAASAAGVLLLAWAFAPRPAEVETAEARLARFETTVDEDGRTRVRDRYGVSAPLAGRLERIALREGDAVQAGAVVARLLPVLSPLLDDRTRREQAARVEGADAAIAAAAARSGAAQAALAKARDEVRRSEQLVQQGYVAPSKVESDRRNAEVAQRELEAARQNEQVALHERQVARAALGATTSRSGAGFEVRAPIAGKVLKVHQASEGTVALGAPLLDIGDTARMEIVAELLTADALQAQPGRAVHVEGWGGPGTLAGVVRLVEPSGFTKVSALGVEEQRVRVLIDLSSPREQWAALGDGYRVNVRVVTRAEDRALVVPVGAVFPLPADAQGKARGQAVFVIDAGHVREQPVTVEARNGREAWIRQGLQAGARVVLYPPASLKDGARVRDRSVRD